MSSVFSLIVTRSTKGASDLTFGYDFTGRTFAKRSKYRLKTRMTSAALSPTGALRQTLDFLIISKEKSGSATPYFTFALSPASTSVISNFRVEKLSFIIFSNARPEIARSGPMPSPLTNAILYLVNKIHLRTTFSLLIYSQLTISRFQYFP